MTFDVLVLGGSIPGIVAALECAKLGLKVKLVCREIEVADEPFRDAQKGWRWFADEYSLGELTPIPQQPTYIVNPQKKTVPLPQSSLFGIPSSPLGKDVVRAIGQGAALRAYLDRVKPVLTIGKAHHLGALVENRMGDAVLSTLVEPLILERFGAEPSEIDVAVALPGVNEAITRTGSLSTAVLAQLPAFHEREQLVEFTNASDRTRMLIIEALQYWNVDLSFREPQSGDADDPALAHRALVISGDLEFGQRFIDLGQFGFTRAPSRVSVSVRVKTSAPIGLVTSSRDHAGTPWSVRVENDVDDLVRLRVIESRRLTNLRSNPTSQEEFSAIGFDELKLIVQAALGNECEIAAESINAKVVDAPWLSLEEVHAHQGILSALDSLGETKFVSDSLHAGDSSAAIMQARATTVALRRQLLGIS